MAIVDRLDDCVMLAAAGRWEGALTMALLAVAAAGRAQFPRGTLSKATGKPMGDRETFLEYLHENSMKVRGVRISSRAIRHTDVAGRTMYTDEVLYEYFRCALVHEGEPHAAVALRIEPTAPGVTHLSTGPDPATGKFTISSGYVQWLHSIVQQDLERQGILPMPPGAAALEAKRAELESRRRPR